MADASIRAIITAEDRASAVVKNFGSTVERAGDTIHGLANKAVIAGAAITTAFTAAAALGLKNAASYEQNRIAFEGMLGSADKAQKLLREIAIAGKETPFELSQLVEGGKRLLAYGVAAEDLVATLKRLGDITAIVGTEKMPQLILAYGQVKAATKLTGAEMRQFSEAGVPLLKALTDQLNATGGGTASLAKEAKGAKKDVGELNDKLAIARQRLKEAEATGKAKASTLMSLRNTIQNYEQQIASATTKQTGFSKAVRVTEKDVMEMVSEGKISFEQVDKALKSMTERGGIAFEAMKRQSKSFNGVMSNIKDSATLMLNAIMGIDVEGNIRERSIFALAHTAAERLYDFMNAHSDQIATSIQGIIDKLVTLAVGIKPAVIGFLREFVGVLRDWVIPFLIGVKDAIVALHAHYPRLTEIAGVMAIFAAAFAVNPVVAFTAAAIIGVTALHAHWGALTAGAQQKWDELTAYLRGNKEIQAVFDVLGVAARVVATIIRDVLIPMVRQLIEIMGNMLVPLVEWLKVNLGPAFALGVMGVRTMIDSIRDLIVWIDRVIQKLESVGWAQKQGGVKGFLNSIQNAIVPTAAINSALNALPGRASGGPVEAGRPYIVGEHQPELFIPKQSGTVLPSTRGLGHTTINLSVNVGTFVGTEMEKRRLAQELFRAYDDLQNARGMAA